MSRKNYNENYVGETGGRLSERIISHNGRLKKSHIFKHSVEREYKPPSPQQFSISRGNYHINKFQGKLAESLLIKEKRSTHKRSLYRLNCLSEIMKSFKTLIICMYCNYGSKHFKIFNVCLSLIYFTLHIA